MLASGSVGAPRGALKLGHFAAMRWTHAQHGQPGESSRVQAAAGALPEVLVGGEGLVLGAVDVFGTLLHEATHALAHVRGDEGHSRQGRYHNRRFRDLAAEVGLDVREVPVIGWSDTHVPDTTRAEYADTVKALAAALTIHRRAEGAPTVTHAERRGRRHVDRHDRSGRQRVAQRGRRPLRLRPPNPGHPVRARARPDHLRPVRAALQHHHRDRRPGRGDAWGPSRT